MYINKIVYLDLMKKLLTAEAEASAFKEANKSQQVSLDWLRVRVSQLEKERVILIERMFDVKLPVMEIQKAPQPNQPKKYHPLTEIPSFEGMDDAEAARMGIGWDAAGRVVYKDDNPLTKTS